MPKVIQIEDGGATEEQLNAAVDHFLSLQATRDRQPALVFDENTSTPQIYTRTSNVNSSLVQSE